MKTSKKYFRLFLHVFFSADVQNSYECVFITFVEQQNIIQSYVMDLYIASNNIYAYHVHNFKMKIHIFIYFLT